MNEVKIAKNAFVEHLDLNRMQYMIQKIGYSRLFVEFTETFGVNKRTSDGDTSLLIYESSMNKLGIKAGVAFTSNGDLIYVPEDIPDVLTMEESALYKRVFIQAAQTQIETGTVQLFTNGNIIGAGTEFLKLFSVGNKKIEIVNSLLGNNGVYPLDAVTTDTAAHSSINFPANESGVEFKVIHIFTPSYVPPVGEEKPYFYDTFNLTIEADGESETDTKFCLARFLHETNGVPATITDVRTKVHKFKKSYETAFDKAFTTSDDFKVGADENGAGGKYVATIDAVPMAPRNVRIIDILPDEKIRYIEASQVSKLAKVVKDGLISSRANIYLKWNHDDIQGEGSGSTFNITNSTDDKVFLVDELIGYHLFDWLNNQEYIITDNAATSAGECLLTLTDLNGDAVDITGVVIDGTNYCWIHSDADSYEIVSIPYNVAAQVPGDRKENKIQYGESPVKLDEILWLHIGMKYQIKIRAVKGLSKSAYVILPSGSFEKDSNFDPTTVTYASPTIVKLPIIDSTGATIGAVSTPFGFQVTIVGWTNATDFEVCYTDDPGGADFTSETHPKIITSDRKLDIVVSGLRDYSVKVRPLVSGQEVAAPLETKVTSGAGGNIPENFEIGKVEVNLRTYSGTMTENVGLAAWNLASIVTPSGGSKAVAQITEEKLGSILTDSVGKDFAMDDYYGGNVFSLSPLDGVSVPTVGTFSINTSKAGRQLFKKLQPQDYMLVDGYVDCYTVVGSGGVLVRVYQEGLSNEANADSILVETKDSVPMDTDLIIKQSNGARYMIIDLWDPDELLNENGFSGMITIHARPYVNTKTQTTS